MENSIIYLIFFLTALIAVLLIYIFGDKIYYFFENVLFGVVIAAAGIYFLILLIKEYFENHFFFFFKKKHLFFRGKVIKKYSKQYLVPVPVYINDSDNFSSVGNTHVEHFDEEVVDFQKDDGEIIVISLDEMKNDELVVDEEKNTTVHVVKHFYDSELHLLNVSS